MSIIIAGGAGFIGSCIMHIKYIDLAKGYGIY